MEPLSLDNFIIGHWRRPFTTAMWSLSLSLSLPSRHSRSADRQNDCRGETAGRGRFADDGNCAPSSSSLLASRIPILQHILKILHNLMCAPRGPICGSRNRESFYDPAVIASLNVRVTWPSVLNQPAHESWKILPAETTTRLSCSFLESIREQQFRSRLISHRSSSFDTHGRWTRESPQ